MRKKSLEFISEVTFTQLPNRDWQAYAEEFPRKVVATASTRYWAARALAQTWLALMREHGVPTADDSIRIVPRLTNPREMYLVFILERSDADVMMSIRIAAIGP